MQTAGAESTPRVASLMVLYFYNVSTVEDYKVRRLRMRITNNMIMNVLMNELLLKDNGRDY